MIYVGGEGKAAWSCKLTFVQVRIAAGCLVAVTTYDNEKDEENQDQREIVEAVKDTHLLTPPTLVSILMLCRNGERGMGGCPGSKENKLCTSYPQKMWTTFHQKTSCGQFGWGRVEDKRRVIHSFIHKIQLSLDKLTVLNKYLKYFY